MSLLWKCFFCFLLFRHHYVKLLMRSCEFFWHFENELVTHWGRDTMVTILQMKFWNAFSQMKMFYFDWNWIEIRSWLYNQKFTNIGSDNGLAPNRRQAIIWTNDGLDQWRIYALISLHELNDILINLKNSKEIDPALRPICSVSGIIGKSLAYRRIADAKVGLHWSKNRTGKWL